jgi:hypothetical protein
MNQKLREKIRGKFLKTRETREMEILKKRELDTEIINQNNEITQMKWEDTYQKRIMFYEKNKIYKLDMYTEYLFDTSNV